MKFCKSNVNHESGSALLSISIFSPKDAREIMVDYNQKPKFIWLWIWIDQQSHSKVLNFFNTDRDVRMWAKGIIDIIGFWLSSCILFQYHGILNVSISSGGFVFVPNFEYIPLGLVSEAKLHSCYIALQHIDIWKERNKYTRCNALGSYGVFLYKKNKSGLIVLSVSGMPCCRKNC